MKSCLIQTPESDSDYLYPSYSKVSDHFVFNVSPVLLIPYITLAIIIVVNFSVPNSVPASVQSFSLHLALRYELPLSHANIYKSFKGASRNIILMFYLDTTFEYVIDNGGAVVWPLATNLDCLLNSPSILMSNIMFTLRYLYPGIIFPFLVSPVVTSSSFSNAIWTFAVYFCNYLGSKVSPRFPVNLICLFYCIRDSHPKLIWCAPILVFFLWNNPISTAQSLLNPPV